VKAKGCYLVLLKKDRDGTFSHLSLVMYTGWIIT